MDATLPDGLARSTSPTLAVVIVNFNSWPDSARLVRLLASSEELKQGQLEIIVVDNASSDPPPERLGAGEGIRVILRPDNAGFAAGVNTAWRSTGARWLLLLNPDVLISPDFSSRIACNGSRRLSR